MEKIDAQVSKIAFHRLADILKHKKSTELLKLITFNKKMVHFNHRYVKRNGNAENGQNNRFVPFV